MKTVFDDIDIQLTDGFITAVKNLMQEKMAMMQDQLTPECWSWGRATISDLSDTSCIEMAFGTPEERPADMPEGEDVMLVIAEKKPTPAAVPNFPMFNAM
ncbi:MAG: hypothetical protein HN790_01910 [Methylococcales bacterium]|jgi:hypothetical protein|nr:hypothetical protein [Methylococcales bacterium]